MSEDLPTGPTMVSPWLVLLLSLLFPDLRTPWGRPEGSGHATASSGGLCARDKLTRSRMGQAEGLSREQLISVERLDSVSVCSPLSSRHCLGMHLVPPT